MTDETADIREDLDTYVSHPSVTRNASMIIDDTRIQPGDVIKSPGRSQSDYKLVVDCHEDELICYVPETDTYLSYPSDQLSVELSEDLVIHHPQMIRNPHPRR